MGFLSDLTMVQRAGGAVVLVLLLTVLLLKQRKAKGASASAKSSDTPNAAKSKKRGSTPNATKDRSFGLSRKRKSDDVVADEPLAEPKAAGQGRMVPRLPAHSEAAVAAPVLADADSPEIADPDDVAPMAAANGLINEPGWPTPGEVWAAPDAPVRESAEVESWQAETQDDALAALAEAPAAHAGEWASDDGSSFDQPEGWEASFDDASAPAGQTDATWQAEEETFDWAAGDAIDGWATSEASTPALDLTSDAAAWEAPEDEAPSWSASETSEWGAAEQVGQTQAVATAITEEFNGGDWAAPVEEPVAEETETPQIVWDPVDEAEDVDDVIAAVVEAEPVIQFEVQVEPRPNVASEPVVEAAPVAEEIAAVVEPEPVMEIEAEQVVESEPVVEVEAPAERPNVVVLSEMPAVDEELVHDRLRYMAPPEAALEIAVPVAAATPDGVVADPAARWASMAPGGVVQDRCASSPVQSWARLRPGQAPSLTANGANAHHPAPQSSGAPAAAPAPVTAPSLAWWDVPSGMESDPRRGRFALGGYALQAGHQVVSGVTFRDGVVPPPSQWVIGPVVGEVARGTLVLQVDGLLNCRSEDLTVLTDPGFAPTTDGFSLRLAAAATGPFAASGTYIIT